MALAPLSVIGCPVPGASLVGASSFSGPGNVSAIRGDIPSERDELAAPDNEGAVEKRELVERPRRRPRSLIRDEARVRLVRLPRCPAWLEAE